MVSWQKNFADVIGPYNGEITQNCPGGTSEIMWAFKSRETTSARARDEAEGKVERFESGEGVHVPLLV